MNDILQLVGMFALVFAASVGASYALTLLVRRSHRPAAPAPNTPLRFKTGGALYRSRFLGETAEGWVLSPPLQRDHYVPIREGEEIRGEILTPGGVQFFRTHVVSRQTDPARLVVRRPERIELKERREGPRRRDLQGMKAGLDGAPAVLIDLSEHGARMAAVSCPERGERIAVHLPWLGEPKFAYVLESAPPVETDRGGCDVRLRFEEPLELRP